MKHYTLKNGDQFPAIGLGTWKSRPGEVKEAVIHAIKSGYRHIDCAAIYMNEKEIGEAFRYCFENNIVKREELWITSKLWNNAHLRDDVRPAIKNTLADLQLDYLDLYIIHWPVAFKPEKLNAPNAEDYLSLEEAPIIETWRGMEEIQSVGLAKHIGVSNFSIKKLDDLYSKATYKPEVNQVELHPYLQQKELFDYCSQKNIILTGYSPLGSGDRSEGMKKDDEPSLLENKTINKVANKHNASPAQVLISWHVHRGNVVIPKSTNPSRIEQNLASIALQLDDEDLKTIESLDRHYRYVDGRFFVKDSNIYDE